MTFQIAANPDDRRTDDRDQRRDDHLALSGLGDDVDALAVLGLDRAVHDAGVLLELTTDLVDDCAAGAADCLHREGDEQVDHDATDQQTGRALTGRRSRTTMSAAVALGSSALTAANSTIAASTAEPIA